MAHGCGETTPEEDLVIAKQALAAGDLGHATHHIAGLIAHDPLDPEHLELLEELIESASDPLALVPVEDRMYVGAAAIRAEIQARLGQHRDAAELLLQVMQSRPELPFIVWLERWLSAPGAIHALDPDALAMRAQPLADALANDPALREYTLPRLASVLTQVQRVHPGSELLAFVTSITARRAGLLEQALAIAKEAHAKQPSYMATIALAGAHRELGQLEEAIAAFRLAQAAQPEEIGTRLDIGDLLLELGREREALATYREALSIEPNNPWALASARFLELVSGDESALAELHRLAEAGNTRAQQLLDMSGEAAEGLPRLTEATIDVARQLHAQLADRAPASTGGSVRLGLSCLESPSSQIATRRLLVDALGSEARLELEVAEIPEPDPRVPRRPVDHVLWRFDGTDARPAMAPPDPDVQRAIGMVASGGYDRARWWESAGRLARSLGPSRVRDVLATMVHLPPTPLGRPPWELLFELQVAAAFVAAQLDSGWEGTARRSALRSMLHGPTDWTTIAGILALTELALVEPSLRDIAIDELEDLQETPPSTGGWCLEQPLARALEMLND